MELLPVAERAAASEGDGFARADLGGRDAEGDVPLPRGRRTRIPEGNAVRASEDDVAERGGVERRVRGTVVPPLADHQRRAAGGGFKAVRPPLAADGLPITLHLEGVRIPVAQVAPRQLLLPHVGISRIHRIPLLPDAEHQRLTPLGMILNGNANIHSGLLVLMSGSGPNGRWLFFENLWPPSAETPQKSTDFRGPREPTLRGARRLRWEGSSETTVFKK